jgi:hypothetical protein
MKKIIFLVLLILTIGIAGCGSDTQGAAQAPVTPTVTQPVQPAQPTPQQQAESAVTTFDGIIKPINSLITSYQGELSDISTGAIDPVTGYSDLGKLYGQAQSLYGRVVSIDVSPQYNDSKESLQMATSYLQNSIKESKDYMDNQKVSILSSAKDDLQQALNGIKIVNQAVATQAIKDGYTPPSK